MKLDHQKTLESLEPPLLQLEDTILNCMLCSPKMDYTTMSFRAIVQIFVSGVLDKMIDVQNKDDMSEEDRKIMQSSCFKDIKKLIHTYTNIDTHTL